MIALRTIDELIVWLKRADKGDRAIYYYGDLAYERPNSRTQIADAVWKLAEQKRVTLVQRRRYDLGAHTFEYIVEKTK